MRLWPQMLSLTNAASIYFSCVCGTSVEILSHPAETDAHASYRKLGKLIEEHKDCRSLRGTCLE